MSGKTGAEGRSQVTAIIFFGLALTSLGAPQTLLTAAGAAYLLSFQGVEMLPVVYVGAAILLLPVAWAVSFANRRYDPATVMVGVTAFRALMAVGLFLGAAYGGEKAVGILAPMWARVDLILALMAMWRLAAKTFDAPGDRRWLVWLAVCEPISTVAMGLIGPIAVNFAGLPAMFLFAALALAASAPPAILIRTELAGAVVGPVRRKRRRSPAELRPLSPSMKSYLMLVISAMVIWTGAHYLLDALFHGMVGDAFEDPLSQFRYFSYTLAAAGLFGTAFAAFGQGRLLRSYGIRLLLVILPLTLIGLIAVGLILSWSLGGSLTLFVAVTAMKVIEFALVSGFYTRAWRALLSPLPETHRDRLINLVNRNVHALGAAGGAGALWLLLNFFGFAALEIGLAFLALSIAGLLVSLLVQRSFVSALERALVRRQSIDEMDVGGADRRSREIVQKMLREDSSKDAIEAARLQAALDVDGFIHMAPRLIAKGEREVVRKLIDTVRELARPELYPPMAGRLTVEEDPELRDALLTAAAATGHPRSPRLLAKAIADYPDDPPIGALIGLGRHGGQYGAAVARQFLERYALKDEAALERALDAARAIGPNAPAGPVAIGLRSADPALRRKAIRAAAKIGDPALANLLVEQLSDPHEWRAATLALAALGKGAVEALARSIGDRSLPLRQRAAALRALGDIYEPEAREQLFLHAMSRDRRLRVYAQLALWRSGAVAGREQAEEFEEHARAEIRDAAEAVLAAHDTKALESPILIDSLRQRARWSLLAAIRASGLDRQRSPEAEARLSALFGHARDWRHAEAAAEALPEALRPVFLAAAKADSAGAIRVLRRHTGHPEREAEDWLGHILSGAEWATDWLQAVAYHYLLRLRPDEADQLAAMTEGAGTLLMLRAKEARAQREGEGDMALNVVEKVLILKSADLFAHVPDEDLAEIAPFLSPVYLDPGETIIREGDLGDELYIVVSGEVKVTKDGVELARRGERAVFGDLAALDPEPRSASVIATKPTQVMCLSNEHLLALFESNVEIASGVIASLIRRLRGKDY